MPPLRCVATTQWSRSQSWCSWKEISIRVRLFSGKIGCFSQLTMWPHRQRFHRSGQGQEGAAETSQWVGTLRSVASWENQLGAVGRWTPHETSTPALLITSTEPQLWTTAHPSHSHEKMKPFWCHVNLYRFFSPFLISSQSRGRDPLNYVHSNK